MKSNGNQPVIWRVMHTGAHEVAMMDEMLMELSGNHTMEYSVLNDVQIMGESWGNPQGIIRASSGNLDKIFGEITGHQNCTLEEIHVPVNECQ